jgi:hypothetical protein
LVLTLALTFDPLPPGEETTIGRFWFTNDRPANPVTDLSKDAEVTVPSLADWEKDWQENPQRKVQPKLLPVNFLSPLAVIGQSN